MQTDIIVVFNNTPRERIRAAAGVGFAEAVGYMSEHYTKSSFSKFTEVLVSSVAENPVVVVGGRDYENINVERDNIVENVLPNHDIRTFEFTDIEKEEIIVYYEEWEQNYKNDNFDRTEFMERFKATEAISRYAVFLDENVDNTFVDVSAYHGEEYATMNSIPDPLYYYERDEKFGGKTKYENWGK